MTVFLEEIKGMFDSAEIPYPTHTLDCKIPQDSMKALLNTSFHLTEKLQVVKDTA